MGNANSEPVVDEILFPVNSKSRLPEEVKRKLHGCRIREPNHFKTLYLQRLMISDRMIPELCECLVKLRGLFETLWITSTGASLLFQQLKLHKIPIKQLSLMENQIDDEVMISLGEYLQGDIVVHDFKIDPNTSSATATAATSDLVTAAQSVSTLTSDVRLTSLSLNGNKGITQKSVPALINMTEASHLITFDLKCTSITDATFIDTILVCNGVKNNTENLNFYNKKVTDEDIEKLCELMKTYGVSRLKILNLGGSGITSKSTILLLKTLVDLNAKLSTISLNRNKLGDEFLEDLGRLINTSQTVQSLGLTDTDITDNGVDVLVRYLAGSETFNHLSLDDNKSITNKSYYNLVEIAKASVVQTISVYGTSLSSEEKKELHELSKLPVNQRDITIKSNTKSAAKSSKHS